jgi:hypothetical protein
MNISIINIVSIRDDRLLISDNYSYPSSYDYYSHIMEEIDQQLTHTIIIIYFL